MIKVELNKANRIPIYLQIEEQIRLLIHNGSLKPGDAMPTVRELAVQLRINANTVARVYRDLQGAGILELRRGIGSFISHTCPDQSVSDQKFTSIRTLAQELVGLAKESGLGSVELQQLIQQSWKEDK